MKMRVTEAGRRRLYLTRHMYADAGGDVADIDARSVDAARALGYVEDIGADAPAVIAPHQEVAAEPKAGKRKRGRPRKVQAAAPKEQAADPFEGKTVPVLEKMAEEQGVELPSGYVKRDKLIELIEDHEEVQKPAEEADETDKADTASEKGAPWSWQRR